MEITGIVTDRNGRILTDNDLENKTIKDKNYYDIVLQIRNKINKEVCDK